MNKEHVEFVEIIKKWGDSWKVYAVTQADVKRFDNEEAQRRQKMLDQVMGCNYIPDVFDKELMRVSYQERQLYEVGGSLYGYY